MLDLPQIILLAVIVTIAVILTIVGIQMIQLLKEARVTLRRTDHILADLEFLTSMLTRSSARLANIAEGLQSGVRLVEVVAKAIGGRQKKSEERVG